MTLAPALALVFRVPQAEWDAAVSRILRATAGTWREASKAVSKEGR